MYQCGASGPLWRRSEVWVLIIILMVISSIAMLLAFGFSLEAAILGGAGIVLVAGRTARRAVIHFRRSGLI